MSKCGSCVGDGAFPLLCIFRLTYPGIKWTCWGTSIGPFFSLGLIQLILAFMSLWSASRLITVGFAHVSWAPGMTGLTLPHPLAHCQSHFSGLVDTAETGMSMIRACKAWGAVYT